MQIRFVTRSGSNQFTRQQLLLHAARQVELEHLVQQPRPAAGSATGKAPKAEDVLYQPGTRVGGPIVIPGPVQRPRQGVLLRQLRGVALAGHRTPQTATSCIHAPSRAWFRYTASGQTREVNVLQLAAANGQLATIDPTIGRLLGDIRSDAPAQGGARPT